MLLSLLVGVGSGLIAVFIKNTAHSLGDYLRDASRSSTWENYNLLILPLIGIVASVLWIKYIVRKPESNGFSTILYAIAKRSGIMKRHHMYSSIISSILTAGFGGSIGLEAPAASSASSLSSNLARMLHLNFKDRMLLIGCATAGTIASIFNAPIAALVLAMEVLMLDLTMASIIPLLIASVSATISSRLILGDALLLHIDLVEQFKVSNLYWYILLGVFCGFLSVLFTKVFYQTTHLLKKIKHKINRAILGGIFLGVLIFLIPPLFGEGFETINLLLADKGQEIITGNYVESICTSETALLLVIFSMIFFKIIATSVTVGVGGIGGVFAPALFLGSALGFVFAKFVNHFFLLELSISNFSLVSMAGLIAGVLHAPLTAIFLIAEITSGYELFIPLMTVAAISYVCSKYFIPHSLFNLQLALKGELMTHNKDKAVLMQMQLEKLVEKNFSTIQPEMNLGTLVKVVAESKRNIFPVVNENNIFLGIINLDDIRKVMFDQSLYTKFTVSDLMHQPMGSIKLYDPMDKVMAKFKETGAWNLAVTCQGEYIGFISKSKLFSNYRRKLVEFSEE
ncbi:MAG: chloride channel protein [Flavobacteriales bacterium]|nr:chloride channel protein [Flavobacteriales bacterium]|tara:strand:+ start:7 stop:1713 length:1707 start_codon:yes stop_codon:yes gene_type:complete